MFHQLRLYFQPKNEANRSQLRACATQGVPFSGNSRAFPVSTELIEESIIISDMFDLDEFLALELLCTAQHQMVHYPGLPRGLVAVLLYYDGRKAVANSIRDLFQITSGVSWVPESPKKLVQLVSLFSQNLVEDSNILDRIIDLLNELDIVKEVFIFMLWCLLLNLFYWNNSSSVKTSIFRIFFQR